MAIRIEQNKKLSQEQQREYHDAFAMYDRNNKGHISNLQLKSLLRTSGFNPTDKEVDQLCLEVDYNGNGKVDFNEFLDLMANLTSNSNEEATYLDAFRAFDENNKGYIQASDIRESLMAVMNERSSEDKDLIKKIFHLDQNRKITFEEFKLILGTPF